MRIYSRYLVREVLAHFLLSLLALLSIYLLVDFFSKVDNAMENQAGIGVLLFFLLNQIPFILGKFIPLALLLATMLALGNLAQHNEIVAFQAGGVGISRLLRPLLLVGLICGGLSFVLNNELVPVTSLKADYLETVVIRGKKEKELYSLERLWYVGSSGIYYLEGLDPGPRTIARAQIYGFGEDRHLRWRQDLEGLTYDPEAGGWVAARARLRQFRREQGFTDVVAYEEAENLPLKLTESFADFMVPRKEPDRMSLKELRAYIGKARSAGLGYLEYTVEIYNRLFYPLSCLLMVVLAVPFSLSSRRSGGAARGIALSLVLGFSFWVALSFSLALGQGRLLSPPVAALGPYLLYGAGAWFMFRRLNG